jgi:hypothetical protein
MPICLGAGLLGISKDQFRSGEVHVGGFLEKRIDLRFFQECQYELNQFGGRFQAMKESRNFSPSDRAAGLRGPKHAIQP